MVFFCGSLASAAPNPLDRHVLLLTVDQPIGPATDDYIQRALETAARQQAALVVIRMDTPGGLDSAMRDIIKHLISSAVPVATYVSPSGARAASAGTYILYASHIAAMAPGTNLGAATPVQIGGLQPPAPESAPESAPGKAGDKTQAPTEVPQKTAMQKKVINDAVAYIRSLAELRGRNADWAEKAVREAASLPASEALSLGVIDIVATGMGDLLQQIEGRKVLVAGQNRRLQVTGLPVRELAPDWRTRLLSVITNPNVAYILMMIGIYGLILEFSNPGAIVPGTVGAISLLLALYAFQLLPINYAGIGLILLGVALMVAEAFQPSFGILGIGGVIAFVFGSIILLDTEAPGFGINLAVIALFALLSALVFIIVIGMAIRARQRKVVSGLEQLLGGEASVLGDFDQQGMVAIHSEHWRAHTQTPLHKDQIVRVTGLKGLILEVEPVEPPHQEKKS
ncbi:MAG: nodulation protein NfeD [Gammaproteobacteria bacterium]|nr:nodulation protein NfeD [Gammaproteobacteria bacterium]